MLEQGGVDVDVGIDDDIGISDLCVCGSVFQLFFNFLQMLFLGLGLEMQLFDTIDQLLIFELEFKLGYLADIEHSFLHASQIKLKFIQTIARIINLFNHHKPMKIALLLICLVLAIHAREKIKYLEQPLENAEQQLVYDQEQYWFDQVLDHFNYKITTYWKQRYFVISEYFKPNVGPVLLYICGEYTCGGVPQARKWPIVMAQRWQGLVLVLEHRYYGKSLPFGNNSLKLQNMQWLNSEQALKDLAYFTEQMVANKMYRINKNPWISIGGSYPGALSAWYRYKYPHLTIGSIASSAVVNAFAYYPQFDEQMFLSANKSGDYCWKAINDTSARVQQILKTSEGAAFKSQFAGADKLSDVEFLFFWSDAIVEKIQYGSRTQLCDNVKGKSADDLLKIFIEIVKENSVYEYGSYYLQNDTYYAVNLDSSRAWMFQCCTEYGWWQTVSDVHPLRSKQIDINFYKKFCQDSFGTNLWPDTDRKNTEYGALDFKAFNLLMSNGDEDPWKWASLTKSQGNIISRVANCSNCAHCVDLYTPTGYDSNELKKIRDEQFLTISEWIDEYWREVKSGPLRMSQNIAIE